MVLDVKVDTTPCKEVWGEPRGHSLPQRPHVRVDGGGNLPAMLLQRSSGIYKAVPHQPLRGETAMQSMQL